MQSNIKIQSSSIKKKEKVVPKKEEIVNKETQIIEKIIFTNELNDRKSLDQVESLQDVQQDYKEENADQFIKEALKVS